MSYRHVSKLFVAVLFCLTTSTISTQTTEGENQLHWHDLGVKLVALRSMGIPDGEIINTRLVIDNLSRVEIKPSLISNAGKGVFATMDCKEGELLTCYPGDVLLQNSGFTGLPDDLKNDEDKLQSRLSRYCIGVTDDYAIMGLPELDQDMAYVGHMINDAARPPVTEADLENYTTESDRLANAEIVSLEDLHMVAIATRDIKKGEEIYGSYGIQYWTDHTDTWRGGKVQEDEEFVFYVDV